MPWRQTPFGDQKLYRGRKPKETDRIGYGSSVLGHPARQLFLSHPERLQEVLVGLSLLDRIQLLALYVLD